MMSKQLQPPRRWWALAVFVMVSLMSLAAHALPSVEAVQAEVQRGNYIQAESMMRDVVAARPNSARAHYVYAEILAHGRRFDMAAQELRLAKQLDPEIRFTQAERFKSFEQLLEREQQRAKTNGAPPSSTSLPSSSLSTTPAAADPPPALRTTPAVARNDNGSGGSLPGWVWGAGFAVVAVLLWRLFSRRRQAASVAGGTGFPAGAAAAPGGVYGGPSPGYGTMPGGAPGVGGSGMLGTGLAAAGGFAAGMLADRLLHSGRDGADHASASSLSHGNASADGLGAGGGFFDNPAADELCRRDVDFGSGDGWGGADDSGGGGGGSDDGW